MPAVDHDGLLAQPQPRCVCLCVTARWRSLGSSCTHEGGVRGVQGCGLLSRKATRVKSGPADSDPAVSCPSGDRWGTGGGQVGDRWGTGGGQQGGRLWGQGMP